MKSTKALSSFVARHPVTFEVAATSSNLVIEQLAPTSQTKEASKNCFAAEGRWERSWKKFLI
jgi:hypothetical protein